MTHMGKHFDSTKSSLAELPQLDTAKRYDIYCSELGARAVVYRTAIFKEIVRLPLGEPTDCMVCCVINPQKGANFT